jgi:Arc/MetJ family transcription regulator
MRLPRSAIRQQIYDSRCVYTGCMSKHLVDIDEEALKAARAKLGTETIKDTVNGALRRASGDHVSNVKDRLDALARAELAAREEAWR